MSVRHDLAVVEARACLVARTSAGRYHWAAATAAGRPRRGRKTTARGIGPASGAAAGRQGYSKQAERLTWHLQDRLATFMLFGTTCLQERSRSDLLGHGRVDLRGSLRIRRHLMSRSLR